MYSFDKQLILEDGSVYKGYGFGSDSEIPGEVVFNTAMTGYQETISDPSYNGQIITFTYPLIGNYGINRDDYETINPSIKGRHLKSFCSPRWRPFYTRGGLTLTTLFSSSGRTGDLFPRLKAPKISACLFSEADAHFSYSVFTAAAGSAAH